jgi:hypothetical protein
MAAVARAAVAATAMVVAVATAAAATAMVAVATAATASGRAGTKRVDAFRDARLKLVVASGRAAALAWAIAPLQERESTRVRATVAKAMAEVAEVAEAAEARPT